MFVELAKARSRSIDRGRQEDTEANARKMEALAMGLRELELKRLQRADEDDREWRRAQLIRDGFSQEDSTDEGIHSPPRTINVPEIPGSLMEGVGLTPNGVEIRRPKRATSFSPETIAAAKSKVSTRRNPANSVSFGGKNYSFVRGNSDAVQRRRTAEADEREAEIRAVNATLPPNERLSETRIKLTALSPTIYAAWAKKVIGVDGTASHAANVDYSNAHPRPRTSTNGGSGNTSRALSGVQSQLSDARSDLGRAESSTAKRPLVWTNPRDSVEFERKSAEVPKLRSKVDSLSNVRDSLVQETQRASANRSRSNQTNSLRPLTPSELARVKTDRDYREYKESLGYQFDR